MFLRSGGGNNDFLSVNFAYGLAAAFAIYICGSVSGGYINPAVTITMCLFGKLKWHKLPIYWLAQYFGAIVGAGNLYFTYSNSISHLDLLKDENETALIFTPGVFATYPASHMNLAPAFLDQVVGTAILLTVVFALTDKRNDIPNSPLLIGLTIGVIGMTYGIQCGYAINPARDLAPRLFTIIMKRSEVLRKGNQNFGYFFWIPIVGPHLGAVLGALVYEALFRVRWVSDDETTQEIKPSTKPKPATIIDVAAVKRKGPPSLESETRLPIEEFHKKESVKVLKTHSIDEDNHFDKVPLSGLRKISVMVMRKLSGIEKSGYERCPK